MFATILKLLVLLGVITIYSCDDPCAKKNPCHCQLITGHIIDISSLGKKDGTARFPNVPDPTNNNSYSYNPCHAFTETAGVACQNVAACQKTGGGDFFNLGSQDSAVFYTNGSDLRINYTSQPRTFSVILVCDDAEEGNLISEGEFPPNFYSFRLITKCACPNGCLTDLSDGSLSTGSVMVILLLVIILCYLLGGMVFQKIVKGATGTELFPNHDFWMDFPILIRDGVIFACNGCQREASYDRI